MISNIHNYPTQLYSAITTCAHVGALIIESRDKVQVNYQGRIILMAEGRTEGWLVTMGSDHSPHKSSEKNNAQDAK